MSQTNTTTIQVNGRLKARLDEAKEITGESYGAIVDDALDALSEIRPDLAGISRRKLPTQGQISKPNGGADDQPE